LASPGVDFCLKLGDHARRPVRAVACQNRSADKRVFAIANGAAGHPQRPGFAAAAKSGIGRVSLWKNEGKNRLREPV
jgi:hypothetical protein